MGKGINSQFKNNKMQDDIPVLYDLTLVDGSEIKRAFFVGHGRFFESDEPFFRDAMFDSTGTCGYILGENIESATVSANQQGAKELEDFCIEELKEANATRRARGDADFLLNASSVLMPSFPQGMPILGRCRTNEPHRHYRQLQVKEFHGTGRNEPCPCGTGAKYKKCHGA